VLNRRHLEAYLFDDEVITALCSASGQPHRAAEALQVKADAVAASVARGNDADDVKRAAGAISEGLRRLLTLQGAGSSADAFARDTMAPLLAPPMAAYRELWECIFG
jgi:hypothetical protein